MPWPLQSGLEVATRAVFDLGNQSSADFLRPVGEAALVPPDSVSWRVFKNQNHPNGDAHHMQLGRDRLHRNVEENLLEPGGNHEHD
jgi:hypothetical protein